MIRRRRRVGLNSNDGESESDVLKSIDLYSTAIRTEMYRRRLVMFLINLTRIADTLIYLIELTTASVRTQSILKETSAYFD